MSELAVIAAVGFVSAVIAHIFVARYWKACAAASVGGAVLLLVINTADIGYLDPFFPIAFFFSAIGYFLIAMLVGVVAVEVRAPKYEAPHLPDKAQEPREQDPEI